MVLHGNRGSEEPHEARTKCCCASCGAPTEHETRTCVVAMQNGDEEGTCVVCQVEYPPQGRFESVIEALITSYNVHEEDAGFDKVGSHRRVYGGLRSHTLEELTEFWQVWSEYDRPIEQVVTWTDISSPTSR